MIVVDGNCQQEVFGTVDKCKRAPHPSLQLSTIQGEPVYLTLRFIHFYEKLIFISNISSGQEIKMQLQHVLYRSLLKPDGALR